eukprot:6179478-Pleurochrysis_carterae.AAC.2
MHARLLIDCSSAVPIRRSPLSMSIFVDARLIHKFSPNWSIVNSAAEFCLSRPTLTLESAPFPAAAYEADIFAPISSRRSIRFVS